MPASFGTASYTPDQLPVGGPFEAKAITLLSGQSLPRGAVLGLVTASQKHSLSVAAATDGSQTPSVILAEAADASGGDVPALAYVSGTFNAAGLTFGAGHSAASVFDPLRAVGILTIKPLG